MIPFIVQLLSIPRRQDAGEDRSFLEG